MIRGRCASPGVAHGRVCVLAKTEHNKCVLSAEQGTARLRDALELSCSQLRKLMGKSGGDAADMLEFQAELAKDPSLSEEAFARIEAGEGAMVAWEAAMGAQIREYEGDDDEHFRARAADLADLRDRVARNLAGVDEGKIAPGSLVHADDIGPSVFMSTDWEGGGVLLANGSPTSHVAMLARSMKVPMVVGLGWHPDLDGLDCVVDAKEGLVTVGPDAGQLADHERRRRLLEDRAKEAARHQHELAMTAGGERVLTAINVASVEEAEAVDPSDTDGIGLARTEFLFRSQLAGEDEQYDCYRRLVRWADGRPVTIRTLDGGGDKPIPGYTVDGESNPFLGTRGLRLSLRDTDVFCAQVRAILRAGEHGPVRLMLPMVTLVDEFDRARGLIAEQSRSLGLATEPPVGMMVEVPAAAMMMEGFDADFYSIGSNDLTQYLSACGRDVAGLSDLVEGCLPAVLALVRKVVEHGARSGRQVSLCGDLAGDADRTADLLGTGLRSLSMPAGMLGEVKAAIASWK